MVGFVLLCYALGVLISLPEIPLSINGMPTKFSGESAFALMSLLGANIMPHNFYLHSSIVKVTPSLPPSLPLCVYVCVCCVFHPSPHIPFPFFFPFSKCIGMRMCLHACLGKGSKGIIVTERT